MTWDRVAIVEQLLDPAIASAPAPDRRLSPRDPLQPGSTLTAAAAMAIFEDQVTSRQLDVAARELKKTGRSFYTIGSAGHEHNAVVGARPAHPPIPRFCTTGPAPCMARARQLPGRRRRSTRCLASWPERRSDLTGSTQGLGQPPLWVPPQTSTIASHLPKAMGLAFSLARARRLGVASGLPDDALVACSFGDASANHATALSAINTARYAVRIGLPMPLLLLCEDNGTGISVPTPDGWVARDIRQRSPTFATCWPTASWTRSGTRPATAIDHVRTTRQPAFLHLRTVRLWGHAGSDAEQCVSHRRRDLRR